MRNLLLFIALALPVVVSAQDLYTSERSSAKFLFQISSEEARIIYEKGINSVNESFFHTIVDTIPRSAQFIVDYDDQLASGHYILGNVAGEKLFYQYFSNLPFDIQVLQNNQELVLKIQDESDNPVKAVNVKVGKKKLRYDKKSGTYRLKRKIKKGLVEVEYDNQKAFGWIENEKVKKNRNYPWWKRLLYGKPQRYVTLPIRYIIHLPIDGFKSIRSKYPVGSIATTKNIIRKIDRFFKCKFLDSGCKNEKYQGYMVSSKPKYKVNDTLRVKAYIETEKGKPLTKDLDVYLSSANGTKIGTVKPYRPGGYTFEVVLDKEKHKLKLDKTYRLLFKEKRNTVKSVRFKFEQYELRSINLDLNASKKHIANIPFELKIEGKDENDLNIFDGRIKLEIKSLHVNNFLADSIFVPNQLLDTTFALRTDSTTIFTVPDSIFPPVDMNYQVVVKLFNSENQTKEQSKKVQYLHNDETVKFELVRDSAVIKYFKNNKEESVTAELFEIRGKQHSLGELQLPTKIKLDNRVLRYNVKNANRNHSFNLNSYESELNVYTERTGDSIFVQVLNPRNLGFSYFVYKVNKEVDRGFGTSLNYRIAANNIKNYTFSIEYLWAGKVVNKHFSIVSKEKEIQLLVEHQQEVFPGQKSTVEVTALDHKSDPIENMDLTAYAYTSKFNQDPPVFRPRNRKKAKKQRVIKNNYKFRKATFHGTGDINYEFWNDLAFLDSMAYYQFLFPGSELYSSEFAVADSVTQVAPFIVKEGKVVRVHVLQIDNRPVYFSWANNYRPYSFKTTPGYHQIKFRTENQEIILDSVLIRPFVKNVFSLDIGKVVKNTKKSKLPNELTKNELQIFNKYNFFYNNNFHKKPAYLEVNGEYHILNSTHYKQKLKIAGPIQPQWLNFNFSKEYSHRFLNEYNFSFEFRPGLMKLKEVNASNLFLGKLNKFGGAIPKPLAKNEVYTKKYLEAFYLNYLLDKRRSTSYRDTRIGRSNSPGFLQIGYAATSGEELPVNVLIFDLEEYGQFDILSGNVKKIGYLDQGFYRLVMLYKDGFYRTVDSIAVKSHGINYYNIDDALLMQPDSFSISIDSMLNNNLQENRTDFSEDQVRQLSSQLQSKWSEDYPGYIINGNVQDEEGENLIGANVYVNGTIIGTMTNLDGAFSLKIPFEYDEVTVNYIGYGSVLIDVSVNSPFLNVTLNDEGHLLEEVVVTGYRAPLIEQNYTTSGSIITSDQISNLPTKNISSLAGVVAGLSIEDAGQDITIRGSRSDAVVYYIDGIAIKDPNYQIAPGSVKDIRTLSGEEARMVYGQEHVVLIRTKKATNDEAFYHANLKSSGIRTNFSDEAFWKPKLRSDEHGKVSFEVTYPDDITKWNLYFQGVGAKGLAGYKKVNVRSYKPLRSQLVLPRFLLEGDATDVIAKTLNYQEDSISVKTSFSINNQEIVTSTIKLKEVHVDKYSVNGIAGDTLDVVYKIEKEDGYFDGEKRSLPILPVGLELTKGVFEALDKDTILTINLEDLLTGPVTIYAESDQLSVVRREIRAVRNYKYLCNEQLASKLSVLLCEKSISKYLNEKFEYDEEIRKIIKLLLERNNKEKLWGWWSGNEVVYWINNHVFQVLKEAKAAGFEVDVDIDKTAQRLVYYLESTANVNQKINILNSLRAFDAKIDYKRYVLDLDTISDKSFLDELKLLEFKSQLSDSFDISLITENMDTTLFGNIYVRNENENIWRHSIRRNKIHQTTLGYNILRRDSLRNHEDALRKMRNFFFEERKNGYWRNTWESANIIKTIYKELLQPRDSIVTPTALTLSGSIDTTITGFPFKMNIENPENLQIQKTGSFPIYLTAYQNYWDSNPARAENNFIVNSYFSNSASDTLQQKAGDQIQLNVSLEVKKDADYFMIEIPIPAGCSYNSKGKGRSPEVHREYYEDKVVVFCKRLMAGKYNFNVDLIAKFTGDYTINPAKASLMYFPTFFANTGLKEIEIIE